MLTPGQWSDHLQTEPCLPPHNTVRNLDGAESVSRGQGGNDPSDLAWRGASHRKLAI